MNWVATMSERSIAVGKADVYAPKPKVESLVEGLSYPFDLKIKNELEYQSVVIPSAKPVEIIKAGESHTTTVNSYEHAWEIVMEVAGAADVKAVEVLATLTVAVPKAAKGAATGDAQ